VDFHLSLCNLCNLCYLWICVLLPPVKTGVSTLVGTDVSDELRRSQATFLTVTTRLLQSAAQRAQRSERRSQMWERERERRSQKRQTHFSFLRSQSLKVTE